MDHSDWCQRYIYGRDETEHFEHRGCVLFEHPRLKEPLNFYQECGSTEKANGDAVDIEVFPVTRIWPTGHRLACWICDNPDLVAGKKVLEVGSGVGIVGITAAAIGAESVTVTDAHVQLLTENVKRSKLTNVTVKKLVWGKTELEEAPELIVGSDIIYNQGPEVMAALVSAVEYFGKKRVGLQFLLAYELRTDWESLRAFRTGATEAGFEIENIPTEGWGDDQMLLQFTYRGK